MYFIVKIKSIGPVLRNRLDTYSHFILHLIRKAELQLNDESQMCHIQRIYKVTDLG